MKRAAGGETSGEAGCATRSKRQRSAGNDGTIGVRAEWLAEFVCASVVAGNLGALEHGLKLGVPVDEPAAGGETPLAVALCSPHPALRERVINAASAEARLQALVGAVRAREWKACTLLLPGLGEELIGRLVGLEAAPAGAWSLLEQLISTTSSPARTTTAQPLEQPQAHATTPRSPRVVPRSQRKALAVRKLLPPIATPMPASQPSVPSTLPPPSTAEEAKSAAELELELEPEPKAAGKDDGDVEEDDEDDEMLGGGPVRPKRQLEQQSSGVASGEVPRQPESRPKDLETTPGKTKELQAAERDDSASLLPPGSEELFPRLRRELSAADEARVASFLKHKLACEVGFGAERLPLWQLAQREGIAASVVDKWFDMIRVRSNLRKDAIVLFRSAFAADLLAGKGSVDSLAGLHALDSRGVAVALHEARLMLMPVQLQGHWFLVDAEQRLAEADGSLEELSVRVWNSHQHSTPEVRRASRRIGRLVFKPLLAAARERDQALAAAEGRAAPPAPRLTMRIRTQISQNSPADAAVGVCAVGNLRAGGMDEQAVIDYVCAEEEASGEREFRLQDAAECGAESFIGRFRPRMLADLLRLAEETSPAPSPPVQDAAPNVTTTTTTTTTTTKHSGGAGLQQQRQRRRRMRYVTETQEE